MKTARNVIRHSADRSQVFLAIVGPLLLIGPFFLSLSWLQEFGLWFVVWCAISRHNYILHNHVHCPFTRSRYLNRVLNALLGFTTGMTAGIWKITHVHGHHVEDLTNLPRVVAYMRPFRIPTSEQYSAASAAWHALRTAPTQWVRPIAVMFRGAFGADRFRRGFHRYHLIEFLLIYTIVAGLFILDPRKATLYFGVNYAIVYLVSRHVDYITHVGSHGDADYGFANICLHEKYNRMLWNFGHHLAHHMDPSAHWTTLSARQADLGIAPAPGCAARETNYFGGLSPLSYEWHRVRKAE